jgi:DNA sulfur modification protein DndC
VFARLDQAARRYSDFIIAYSGGKDSTALVSLAASWLRSGSLRAASVRSCTLLFCDTGVENPHIRNQVFEVLEEWKSLRLPVNCELRSVVVRPAPADSFLVKVIGRGYPAPTSKFRWCTDRLRVKPVREFIRSNPRALVLLGARRGESEARDRTLRHYRIGRTCFFRQEGESRQVFCPLLDLTTKEIWRILLGTVCGQAFHANRLSMLYRDAAGGCPSVFDPKGSPCGAGRFGCWTCTVVNRDHSGEALAEEGWAAMAQLLQWRNSLQRASRNPNARWSRRRNRQPGPGPLRLATRRRLLAELREAEARSGMKLLTQAEEQLIQALWRIDQRKSGRS